MTVQKTEDELFAEIVEARNAGKDINALLKDTEVSNSTEVEEPEVATTVVTEEEKDTTTSTTADTPAEPVVTDWEAGLTAEVKLEIQKLKDERAQLEHRVKSELGRVPYLQRKVEELSRQTSQPPTAPVKEVVAATKTSGKFAERLAQAREVDPALADLLEAMAEEIATPLREELTNEVTQTKQAIADKEYTALWQSEKAKLLELVPQADEVFKHPLYKQWKDEIPENLHRLASSVYADEVVIALEQFAKYAATQAPSEPVTAPQQTPTVNQAIIETAAKVTADRARKLTGGATTTQSTPPRQGTGVPEDPEALFNYLTDKIRKNEPYKV